MKDKIDITDKIAGNSGNTEWPMCSYDRPAYLFWNGIANGLKKNGATIKEIQWWLQSKCARWTLDGMGNEIEKLGEAVGSEQNIKSLRKDIKSDNNLNIHLK